MNIDTVRIAAAHAPPVRPSVTVAICTYDRARDVSRCLEALAPQARQALFRTIVVDSGSGPATAVELRRLAALHGVEYYRVETPGVSLARNIAHRQSTSDWIVYLDDDAIPDPDWAESLLLTLSAAPAEVAVIGGKIRPKWPDNADTGHITDRWKLLLSCVEQDGSGLVSEGYNVCCANLAVRRTSLDQAGGFPLKIGSVGTKMIFGEESYLIDRLFDLGAISVYSDAFAVQHCISPERLELQWISGRAYREGMSRVRIMAALGRPIPFNLGMAKLLASLPVLGALRILSSNPDYAIRYHMARGSLLYQVGELMRWLTPPRNRRT